MPYKVESELQTARLAERLGLRAAAIRHSGGFDSAGQGGDESPADGDCGDDALSLLFICSHPDLSPDERMTMMLHEACGLSAEAIAAAVDSPVPVISERLAAARARLHDFELPGEADWHARIGSLFATLYRLFLYGSDLAGHAIGLARLLADLVIDGEAQGLLALMLLLEARRVTHGDGPLDAAPEADEDRSLWDRSLITEGQAVIARALASPSVGPYTLQAAIADLHVRAPSLAETDWDQIVGLQDMVMWLASSSEIAAGRDAAVAQRDAH